MKRKEHTVETASTDDKGLVLVCDKNGVVAEVIHDGMHALERFESEKSWLQIIDKECLPKAESFMTELQAKGVCFDWELNMHIHGIAQSVRFAGVVEQDRLTIVAAKTNHGLSELLEEFMRIGNEQTNQLRKVLKENIELKSRMGNDSLLYDEISRLNNELVNLQRELTKKNIELRKLNDLKNRFIGIAAHDLRTPLGNILSLSEFLEEEIDTSDENHLEYLRLIKESSRFMLNMVEELLDVSAIESGEIQLDLQPIDLVALVGNMVEFNAMHAEKKNIRFQFHSGPESVLLMIDKGKIEQVITNLLTNAVKYSQENTNVAILLEESEEGITTQVRDQGQGIAADEVELLFKPFQKTSTISTGGEKSTGLGLYIVKRIIEAHGGRIWVESEPGRGSTFGFMLPKSGAPGSMK